MVALALAALVAAFAVGQDRGTNLGIEATMALCFPSPPPGTRVLM